MSTSARDLRKLENRWTFGMFQIENYIADFPWTFLCSTAPKLKTAFCRCEMCGTFVSLPRMSQHLVIRVCHSKKSHLKHSSAGLAIQKPFSETSYRNIAQKNGQLFGAKGRRRCQSCDHRDYPPRPSPVFHCVSSRTWKGWLEVLWIIVLKKWEMRLQTYFFHFVFNCNILQLNYT